MEYAPTPEDAARAGLEIENPTPDTPVSRDRGAVVFRNICSACHGAAGGGDGPVAKRGYPPPPTFHRPESKALRDGEMFHAVTYGRKNMPALGRIVAPEDRWLAIRYVRALQEGR
jgi:mono/diheme cytochrome c family protein